MRARTILVVMLAVFLSVLLSLAPLLPFFTRQFSQGLGLSELTTLREYVEENAVEYYAENSQLLLPVLAIGCVIGASVSLYTERRLRSTEG